MEEIRLRKSGLVMVDSSELTAVKGGYGGYLYRAARIASAVCDYLPSFFRGFKRGWNSR